MVPLAIAVWGLYGILGQTTYRPSSYRSWHHWQGGWVHGAEAVRLGILWVVVAGYAAAEFWLPERIMKRPVRVMMGIALVLLIGLLMATIR